MKHSVSEPKAAAGGLRDVTARLEQLLADHPPQERDPRASRAAQYDLGLAWVAHPKGLGGLGVSTAHQAHVDETVVAAGGQLCWSVNPIGYGMAAPTLLRYLGPNADRFLRPLFTGEELWCQLFSEPAAGSDLAGMATRAVRDGAEWVVDGQKVWTSLAHLARWGLLLCRTDPDAPKHAGLTYFVLDMTAPGVEVRPLRQATGDAEFNEVFLTGVRIPDTARIGPVHGGWTVALTTLMNERVAIGGQRQPRGSGPIATAVDLFRETGATAGPLRDRLARLWVRAEALRLTNIRAASRAGSGNPGPKGSVGKLAGAELNQDIFDLCVDLLGADGLLAPAVPHDPERLHWAPNTDPRFQFLRSRANTIEGGTSEVLRNVLAERVLGLPAEPRADKGIPWRDIPR